MNKLGRKIGGKTELNSGVGLLISQKRVKMGIPQRILGERLGVTIQFISNIERGRAPLPVNLIKQTSEVLGIPLHELINANLMKLKCVQKVLDITA